MEIIEKLLSRPNVQSVLFSNNRVSVVTKDGIDHTYSKEYFVEKILPKLTNKNEEL